VAAAAEDHEAPDARPAAAARVGRGFNLVGPMTDVLKLKAARGLPNFIAPGLAFFPIPGGLWCSLGWPRPVPSPCGRARASRRELPAGMSAWLGQTLNLNPKTKPSKA
jgi:hypothetical protein